MRKLVPRRVTADLGFRVRELRRACGLTQEELAEALDRSPQTVQNLERGIANLALEELIRLANALGVDLPGLFSTPTDRTPRKPGRPPSEGKAQRKR